MTTDESKVSRGEFYLALTIIWLFIAMAFSTHPHGEGGWKFTWFFLLSGLMGIVCMVKTFRLRRRRRNGPETGKGTPAANNE